MHYFCFDTNSPRLDAPSNSEHSDAETKRDSTGEADPVNDGTKSTTPASTTAAPAGGTGTGTGTRRERLRALALTAVTTARDVQYRVVDVHHNG
jgi:hypothetical protein